MRKINLGQVIFFLAILICIVAAASFTVSHFFSSLELGDFRGIFLLLMGVVTLYLYALLAYRLLLKLQPLPPGQISPSSKNEAIYHVYLLFFLILFYPIMRSGAMPVPLMRIFYLALGARLGDNTYSSGIILDPIFVEIGDNSIVGQFALIVPHVIEGERLAHYPIRIGNNVTIGAHSCVLAGVSIGDGAIIATGAVVPKGTQIGPREVWGGVPARRIHSSNP